MTEDMIIQELEHTPIVENDQVKCCIGLLMTLYFENGHTLEQREAIMQCHDEYWQIAGTHLHWARHPQSGLPTDLTQVSLPLLREWVLQISKDEDLEIMYHGGINKNDANFHSFKVFGRCKGRKKLSYLSATLPLSWFKQPFRDQFIDLAHRFCNLLHPYHGYAGLAVISPIAYWAAREVELSVYPIARRFPGLEVDYPISHVRHLENGIKGVNWLTILADNWLEKLGGKSHLQIQLGKDFIFYDYPGGVIIQAGTHPQVGDVNRQNIPEHYRKLSRLLKPIRVDYPDVLHGDPRGFNQERTQEWFNRFD